MGFNYAVVDADGKDTNQQWRAVDGTPYQMNCDGETVILEVCIDNFRSALAAKSGGADRLEVCGPLSVGGTTPSAGLIEQCVALGGVEIVVMIRPHEGGFCYQPKDVETMLRDIHCAKNLGAQGVVFGALTADNQIDVSTCLHLIDEARPLKITFHRAFDTVPDWRAALDAMLKLKVDRLLTSGLATTAIEGRDTIRHLVKDSGTQLRVIGGSGVTASNVRQLVTETGIVEVHTSGSVADTQTETAIDFGGRPRTTCEVKIRKVRLALDSDY